ncbi:MAG: carboxypeptidase regulatory-like domain-containing protein [Candidatus Hydrogenedentes bacterium]|nr:carboxypeptidase regulatory-like domain-containing protein [Candidatus Hydrogenedentota bacterium]
MANIGQHEGDIFEVTSGEWLEGVILTYDRMLSIAGRVTDEAGNSIAGARISGNAGMLETDADGAYTFANLAPGEYLLQVHAQGYTQAMMHGVPAGDMHADFTLKSSHYEIAGRVVDAVTNEPVRSFEVAWFHFDHTRWVEDNPVMSAATLYQWKPLQHENGQFTLPIDWHVQWTTRAVLIVKAQGYGMALRVVDLGASAQQVQEFRLQPGGRLEGAVVNESGQPVKDVVVFFDVGLTGFTERAAATTNADGQFSIENFPQSEQRLAFCHPAYAKAFVTVSGDTVPLMPLNVTMVAGGSIQVSIEGGEEGAAWQVSVFSENRFKELASAEAHGGGTFTIDHVAPGQATVQVYSRGPNFRTVMLEREIAIEAGAATTADFVVPEGEAALSGVIAVGDQRPQTFRVTARYTLDDGSALTHMALGRNDGAYEILGLPEGNATVEVEATMQDGQVYTESRDISITAGGEFEADFDFTR